MIPSRLSALRVGREGGARRRLEVLCVACRAADFRFRVIAQFSLFWTCAPLPASGSRND
jgi:hypothetical protein